MRVLNRPTLMKAHALLAAFILPVAMMFFITGAFYTWGIKGEYETVVHQIKLDQPLQKKLSELVLLAETELTKRNIAVPTGQAKIKTIGESFKLEWTGLKPRRCYRSRFATTGRATANKKYQLVPAAGSVTQSKRRHPV